MHARNHPSRPGHSVVAWLFFIVGLVAVGGFLMAPYSEIWTYPRWDEDLGSTGWQLLVEAWQLLSEPPGPMAVGFTVSITFGLLTAFSIVCVVPAAMLLWISGYSRVVLWLGRIWWSLLVLPGVIWFFLAENAIRSPGTVDYLHREGMLFYWVAALGIAMAFWVTGRRDRTVGAKV